MRFLATALFAVFITWAGNSASAQDVNQEINEVRSSLPGILQSDLEWIRLRALVWWVIEYRLVLKPGDYENEEFAKGIRQNYREVFRSRTRVQLQALLESRGLREPEGFANRMVEAYGGNQVAFNGFLDRSGLGRYGETFVTDVRKSMIAYGFLNALRFPETIEDFFKGSFIWPFCQFRQ